MNGHLEINIVNLTNHTLNFYPEKYTDIVIFPRVSKKDEVNFLSRCIKIEPVKNRPLTSLSREKEIKTSRIGDKNKKVDIPIYYSHFGVGLLPDYDSSSNTVYIVAQTLYNSLHHLRKDLVIVDYPIRNEVGKVIACRGFSRPVYDQSNKALEPIVEYFRKLLIATSDKSEAQNILAYLQHITNFVSK